MIETAHAKAPLLVVVGGFLGAGKTSLIRTAAAILHERGLRSAAITNDQSAALVDTEMMCKSGIPVEEVTGGCFCCRFSDLAGAAARLAAHAPHVIFAEPVGSCTDLAATVVNPFKELHAERYRLAPLTILVDPARRAELNANNQPELKFLFDHQLAEADIVCFTKSDLYPDIEDIPNVPCRRLSSVTGYGIAAWLDDVSNGLLPSGRAPLSIDYEYYARAEATLAWLNYQGSFQLSEPLSPASVVGPLVDRISDQLDAAHLAIAHIKVMDECHTGWVKATLSQSGFEPHVDGMLDASPSLEHRLIANIRVTGDPNHLQSIVERSIDRLLGTAVQHHCTAFRPAAPKPEHRFV